MATDRIKEELQWLRAAFQILAAVDAALIGYVVQPNTPTQLAPVAGTLALIGVGVLVIVIKTIYRRLRQLE